MIVNQFINGWSNLMKKKFGEVDPNLLELSKKRILICKDCELFNNNVCNRLKKIKNVKTGVEVSGCGCILPAKTLCETCKCPADKW